MLKKTKYFEITDLFIIMAIIIIIASLIAPNVITSIQKSKQKNIGHLDIIKKIKASNRTFNEYVQGIMGVNRAEKELAKSIEILNEHLTKTWRIKPWEKARLSKGEQEKAKKYYRKFGESIIGYR